MNEPPAKSTEYAPMSAFESNDAIKEITELLAEEARIAKEVAAFTNTILTGAFKKIEYFEFEFNCIRCEKNTKRSIPSDVTSEVTCSHCGLLHTAHPNRDFSPKSSS